MTSRYVLWFDARCAASRRTLELLRARGVEPELRRFLEEPPSAEEVLRLLESLGLPAHAVARAEEDEYQALRLSERTPTGELVQALAEHPRILDRPIFVAGARAIVARPPERALELLPPAATNGAAGET